MELRSTSTPRAAEEEKKKQEMFDDSDKVRRINVLLMFDDSDKVRRINIPLDIVFHNIYATFNNKRLSMYLDKHCQNYFVK